MFITKIRFALPVKQVYPGKEWCFPQILLFDAAHLFFLLQNLTTYRKTPIILNYSRKMFWENYKLKGIKSILK